MVKTVYLHIGMNKTGSSAIQQYLAKNYETLLNNGLLYPKAGRQGNAHYALSAFLGFAQIKSPIVDMESSHIKDFRNALDNEISQCKPDILVFSSETFVLLGPVECAKELLKEYDVKIVVYLRRHDKWWPSAYNQAVRTVAQPPWGRTFRSYLNFFEKKRPWVGDYRLLVDRWAEVFGKENVIVRPYETQQNEPGLIHDFMRTIGLNSLVDENAPEHARVNNSIGTEALALVDACQRARIELEIRDRLVSSVLARKVGDVSNGSFHPQLLLELATKHQDDYAYIAKEYLARNDGKLFYDALPDVTGDWIRNKQPSLDEVVELVVSVMKMTPADKVKALA